MAGEHGPDIRLERIQRLILQGHWEVSSHVLQYIEDGEFEIRDIETSIARGWISKSQKDEVGTAVDARKYTISGFDHCGLPFETVGKIVEGPDGEQYFVITAYERR
jgi:hypothetical protein